MGTFVEAWCFHGVLTGPAWAPIVVFALSWWFNGGSLLLPSCLHVASGGGIKVDPWWFNGALMDSNSGL